MTTGGQPFAFWPRHVRLPPSKNMLNPRGNDGGTHVAFGQLLARSIQTGFWHGELTLGALNGLATRKAMETAGYWVSLPSIPYKTQ